VIQEADVEQAAADRLERLIDREVKARFPAGGIWRVAVLRHGDDPAVEPGELTVRLFVETGGGPEDGSGCDLPSAGRRGWPHDSQQPSRARASADLPVAGPWA